MKKRGKRGPKTKLTKELQRRICALLRAAHTIQTCCDAVGISDRIVFHVVRTKPRICGSRAQSQNLGQNPVSWHYPERGENGRPSRGVVVRALWAYRIF